MTVPDLMVTLANGTQVPWSEFKTWSPHKQAMSILKVSAETRARMSAALKGRVITPQHREQLRQASLGQTKTAETRAKISADNIAKGKRPPDATGRKLSAQARQAIGHATFERWHSMEPEFVAWREKEVQRRAAQMAQRGRRWGINATRVLKVFHTPFGEFTHAEEAVEYLRLAGVPNWRRWMENHRKQNPTQYYFTKERVPK